MPSRPNGIGQFHHTHTTNKENQLVPFIPTYTKHLADAVYDMSQKLRSASDLLDLSATNSREWEAAKTLRSAYHALFHAQAMLLVSINWTQECAACLQAHEADGQYEVSQSELFDPPTASWLCGDCSDAAYPNTYSDTEEATYEACVSAHDAYVAHPDDPDLTAAYAEAMKAYAYAAAIAYGATRNKKGN